MDEVKAIFALIAITSMREILGFLKCVRYYQRFIKKYVQKVIPLIKLLKKDVELS